jgi:hypothetical protein
MYDGRTALKEGTVVGHEIIGVIETVERPSRGSRKETGSYFHLMFHVDFVSIVTEGTRKVLDSPGR